MSETDTRARLVYIATANWKVKKGTHTLYTSQTKIQWTPNVTGADLYHEFMLGGAPCIDEGSGDRLGPQQVQRSALWEGD